VIHTPDRRVRVFVSSTLGELRPEREAIRSAVESLRLVPVMFELGARPHAPRELYRAYLKQSDVFIGIYGSSYGWVAPDEEVSGLEDEYRLAGDRPRLLYIKTPAPEREPRLQELIKDFADDDRASYKRFANAEELGELVGDDLAVLLSETFEAARHPGPEERTPGASTVPTPPTPTVGREHVLQRIAEHLHSSRLVTLTGVGGIGKTRLATELALEQQRTGSEAVFVPLAESTDQVQAMRSIQVATDAHAEGNETVLDSIAARLAGRQVLLCLDNLEQIPGVDEVVGTLLERVPDLTVLATSRHALRLQAEQEVRVDPLAVPSVADAADAEVGTAAAVELFVARARAVDERFALTEANSEDIAEITRRLDGIPLAVELAAARTRILSPRSLLERLDDRFALLVGGSPDLPDRQRTLRTTLDWSHGLLTPEEQAVLARLSVFADTWTLEAAEAVCGDDVDSVEALAGLLDKSLVVAREVTDTGEARFGMLQTVRSYAAERLDSSGGTGLFRDRHLDHIRDLGRQAMPHLCGPRQAEWLARLDPDLPNIREAVDHAFDTERPREVVELVWDVIVHYLVRDATDEPRGWLERAQAWHDELDTVTQARLDAIHAAMRLHHGDYTAVHRGLADPIQVFRDHGLDFEVAVSLHQLGFVRFAIDHDMQGALDDLRESSALFASLGHDWGVSLAEAKQGSVLATLGRLDEARDHLAKALAHARRISCEPQEVTALVQLALVQVVDGDWPGAQETLRATCDRLRGGRYLTDGSMCLEAAAAVALHAERPDLAWAATAAATATRDRLGIAPWPTWTDFVDAVHEQAEAPEGTPEDPPGELFVVLDDVLVAVKPGVSAGAGA